MYGVTFSGRKVEPWNTIAADPSILPIGSLVYIPYFQDYPNKGVFRVEDTGSAVKDLHIDIYMEDLKAAQDFGVKILDVVVIRLGW
jgi:3D (Asp-Asp-Asp) domain-containing protein